MDHEQLEERGRLNDEQIAHLCAGEPPLLLNDVTYPGEGPPPMITPFIGGQNRGGNNGGVKRISYGLSSFGYDVRLGDDFQVFDREPPSVSPTGHVGYFAIDPKRFAANMITVLPVVDEQTGERFVLLPAFAAALGHTVEFFDMPADVTAECLGKSTYARCGVFVNVTPLEPGWRGQVTLEFFNSTPAPVKLYVGEGIAQFIFTRGRQPMTTYADRAGKYMNQQGITLPRA